MGGHREAARQEEGGPAVRSGVGEGTKPGATGEQGVWLSTGEDREKQMPRTQSQRDQVTQRPVGRGVRGLGLTRRLWAAGKGF